MKILDKIAYENADSSSIKIICILLKYSLLAAMKFVMRENKSGCFFLNTVYVALFLRYSALNNGVILKSVFGFV